MNLCPLKYIRYEVMHDLRKSSEVQMVITRFPNNYGANLWVKRGSNVTYVAVIRFFDKNIDPNDPQMGPYAIDIDTSITETSVKCSSQNEVENILKKIMNL